MPVSSSSGRAGSSSDTLFWENGREITMFVEPTTIPERPRLMRELQRCGARIVTNPASARIILVDHESAEGGRFARDWPHKVVLDFRWARKALIEGVYASERDDWGGFRAQPAAPEAEREPSITLPTPRRTPASEPPNTMPPPHSAPHQQPRHNSQLDPQSLHTLSQPIGTAVSGNQPMPIPPVAFPQLSHNASSQYPAPPIAAPAMQPSLPNQLQNVSPEIVKFLIDTLRQGGLNATQAQQWPMSGSHQQHPAQPQPQFFANQWPSYGVTGTPVPPIPQFRADNSPVPSASHQARENIPYDDVPSSSSRHTGNGTSRKRKAFLEASSVQDSDVDGPGPGTSRRAGASSQTSRHRHIFVDDEGRKLSFFVQPTLKGRHNLVDNIKKYHGTIVSEYKQADFMILSQTADHFDDTLKAAIAADIPAVKASFVTCCIMEGSLVDHKEFSFDGVTVKRRGKEHVIDLARMRRESRRDKKVPASTTQQQRQRTQSQKLKEIARQNSAHMSPTPSASETSDDSMNDQQSHLEHEERQLAISANRDKRTVLSSASRSPSPVSSILPEEYSKGKYLFTKEEREYWPAYARHVLKYDPDTTVSKLATLLAAKFPHHPRTSWSGLLYREKALLEDIRKKAHIAARKAHRARSPSTEMDQTRPNEIPNRSQSPKTQVPIPRTNHAHLSQDDLNYDRETLIAFLLSGGSENRSDEEVWECLSRLHPCRTQPDWNSFWEEHGEQLTGEVERRAVALQNDIQVKKEDDS